MKINESMRLILDRECFDEEAPGVFSKDTEDHDIHVCIEFDKDKIIPMLDLTSCSDWIESDDDLVIIGKAWQYIKGIAKSLREVK